MNKYTMYAGTAAAMQTAEAKDEEENYIMGTFQKLSD